MSLVTRPGTKAAWRNWAGNHQVTPRRVLTPRSAEEVAAAIRSAAAEDLSVRMIGSGHSFTGVAVAEGLQLRPHLLTAVRSIDTSSGLVTVEAGLPLHRLNRVLADHGLALANMGDIQAQTVAGAAQTATHGTGRDHAGLVSQIVGLEIALADGTVVGCSRDERPELFDAARAGLGALGVVTAITWQTVPAFLLHAREEPMRWNEVLSRIDELDAGNEHFEFFWFPHTEGCLTKRNNRVSGPVAPLPGMRAWLDDELLSNTVFGAINRFSRHLPGSVPFINGVAARALGAREYTDVSHRVFTSARRVRFKEQEYAIPRDLLVPTLKELRALFERKDWRISFPIEVRVLPPEDAWLSMAYDRRSAFIAIHVYNLNPHHDYFQSVEEIMTAVGGRPHWGKMHTRDASYLETVYPKFADFRAMRDKLDPDRRFANPYLRRVLGA